VRLTLELETKLVFSDGSSYTGKTADIGTQGFAMILPGRVNPAPRRTSPSA